MDIRIIDQENGVRVGVYEPGNGIRYTAVAVPWSTMETMGRMGTVDAGWLVVYGNEANAHLLQSGGYLADRYIQEHFDVGTNDSPWAGDLIRALIGRPGG